MTGIVQDTKWMSQSRLLIITYPRTASNLLMRILSISDQPNAIAAESGGYFFMPAIRQLREMNLLDRPYVQWTEAERSEIKNEYQSCFDRLHHMLSSAQTPGGMKTVVVKEHSPFMISPTAQSAYLHGTDVENTACKPWKISLPDMYREDLGGLARNETVMPEEFLALWFPTFLIRHPALAFPSYYRVMLSFQGEDVRKMVGVENQLAEVLTLKWTRMLYDWYMDLWARVGGSTGEKCPVILDSDDILTNPELISRFCDIVQLDPSKIRFTWDPVKKSETESIDPIQRRTRDTLLASSGIVGGKTSNGISLEGEISKWKMEFGETEGSKIERWVKAAMPDYEYLWAKRLTV